MIRLYTIAVLLIVFYYICQFIDNLRLHPRPRRDNRPAAATHARTMGFENPFRSPLYPFLETRTPTDTLVDPFRNKELSNVEKQILIFKNYWLSTQYPRQLAAIVARVIEDRKEDPISIAVCLGISGGFFTGGLGASWELRQFVVFSQIAAQLAAANPEVLNNLIVQDPAMLPEWRALFENHGCRVVDTPAAFTVAGKNSFVFSPFVEPENLIEGLKDQSIDELAMFVGNDIRLIVDERISAFKDKTTIPDEYHLAEKIANSMLDDRFCSHEDLPCARPNGKGYGVAGPMAGLQSLEMWWRPAQTDYQMAQARATGAFTAACKAGFKGNWMEFFRGYRAGFAELERKEQERVVERFIDECQKKGRVVYRFDWTSKPFVDFVTGYLGGLSK